MKLKHSFRNKKLVVFDMDGTLTPSKSPMRRDMARLLEKLLEERKVAVIGGARYGQFKQQFIGRAKFRKELAARLYLFPTSSAAFYRWRGGWKKVYAHELPVTTKKRIMAAFKEMFDVTGYAHPRKLYGRVIEDRGTQITFSAAGQKAPVAVKAAWWKKNDALRRRLAELLARKLPDLEVRVGGLTSIDVTPKGIDKAYGIRRIEKVLGVAVKDILFVGDAIFPGGNDYAVVRTGVDYVKIRGPEETKTVIQFLVGEK